MRLHDRASFARMQADIVSLAARELLPRMVAIQGKSLEADDVLKWLAAWDGAMSPERPEPLMLNPWWRQSGRALYPHQRRPPLRAQWRPRARLVQHVLRNGDSRWCGH